MNDANYIPALVIKCFPLCLVCSHYNALWIFKVTILQCGWYLLSLPGSVAAVYSHYSVLWILLTIITVHTECCLHSLQCNVDYVYSHYIALQSMFIIMHCGCSLQSLQCIMDVVYTPYNAMWMLFTSMTVKCV